MKTIISYLIFMILILVSCNTKQENKKIYSLKFSKQVDSLLNDTVSHGSVIDSLRNQLKAAKHDTIAIDLLNELAYQWKGNTIRILSDEAAKLSEQKNYIYGKIDAIAKRGYYLYWIYKDDSAAVYYKKALNLAEQHGNKKLRAQILNYIGDLHRVHFEYSEANSFYKKAIVLAKEINDESRLSLVYSVQGDINRLQNRYDSALYYYECSLELAIKKKDLQREAFCSAYIGDINRLQGKLVQSLGKLNHALNLATKVKDRNLQAFCYSGCGDLYISLFEPDSALSNMQKALKISREINDLGNVISNLHSIGGIIYGKGKHAEALAYYLEELKVARSINEKVSTANALASIGDYYREKGIEDTSKMYYDSSFVISREINYKLGLLKVTTAKTYDAYNAKKYNEAIEYGIQGVKFAKELGQATQLVEGYRILIRAYTDSKKYKEALMLTNQREHLRDSLVNLEQIKKFATAEYKFVEKNLKEQHEQKEQLNAAQQAKKDEEIKRQQFMRNAFIFGFTIIAIFSVLLFRSLRQNKKQKELIQHQKEIVEEKQKEVMDSIRYAQRIQKALLPSQKYIEKVFKKLRSDK
jgi:hypothetical protein